jgi:hypothetical protein
LQAYSSLWWPELAEKWPDQDIGPDRMWPWPPYCGPIRLVEYIVYTQEKDPDRGPSKMWPWPPYCGLIRLV